MKRPWFPFYVHDWTSDPRLRLISLAAQGLWLNMLCIMHEADPCGHLVIHDIPLDATRLSRMFGGEKPSDIAGYLTELEGLGVFSRTADGVIYSRRMVADAERLAKSAAGGAQAPKHPNASRPGQARKGGRPRVSAEGQIALETAHRSEPERVESHPLASDRAFSPALGFARWFAETAIETGALPAHNRLDLSATAYRLLGDPTVANALLATHGREECEKRARRLMKMRVSRELRRDVTILALSECWDWDAVSGNAPPPPAETGPKIGRIKPEDSDGAFMTRRPA